MKKYCLICAVGLLMAQGCADTARAPALHDFGAADLTSPPPGPQKGETAEIRVTAPKWLSDNRIRYRFLYDQPTRVRFYNLDQWIAPPSELLRLHFASGHFDPHYSLAIHLLNFEQQFDAPGRASVLLRFSVDAFEAGTKNRLGSREFLLRSGNVDPDAQGAVRGFADVAERAKRQVQDWLRESVKAQ
jgi:cholesterol transport system auxiliary component